MTIVQTKDLSFAYPGGDEIQFPNLAVTDREHSLIIGDSGCGKTTLLHLLSGLRRPSRGTVTIADKDISAMSGTPLDVFRGSTIGMIFQTAHFVRALSVRENLRVAQQLTGRIDDELINQLLERLQVIHKADAKTTTLSVGEQQRVAIARALVNSPRVIFADEPTSALDDANTGRVIDLLIEQADRQSATLIVVTHDQRLKDRFTNRISLSS
ncbi:MAG: ATP-binding cassette domain-containing protein [Bacteroidota bacterium]